MDECKPLPVMASVNSRQYCPPSYGQTNEHRHVIHDIQLDYRLTKRHDVVLGEM